MKRLVQMDNNNLAPIALFAFNRPTHLLKTIEALKLNELASLSKLIIYCDGARLKNNEDIELTAQVREIAKNVTGFSEVSVIESKDNLGLANSIIKGVTETCNKFGKIIVLEDDLVTSKYFLKYMNEGLERYQSEDSVISIHGYVYPLTNTIKDPFFITGADCWGWATWKRGWQLFNPNGKDLLQQLINQNRTSDFDFNNSYPYTQMLRDQIEGKNNSWAIRWYASAFLQNKLTLYPNISLIQNIGFDSSGEHCGSTNEFDVCLAEKHDWVFTDKIEENQDAKMQFIAFFNKRNSFKNKVKQQLKRITTWFKHNQV